MCRRIQLTRTDYPKQPQMAKTLGLNIPPCILARATEAIE